MKYTDLLVEKNEILSQAMAKLDKAGKRIVFVEEDGRLVGALSDGDIRRFLLRGGKLDALVSDAMNQTPKFLFDTQRSGAMNYMASNKIDAVPVVDENITVLDVVCLNETVDISRVAIRELVPGDMEKILAFFDQMAGDTRAMFNRGNVNRIRVIEYLEGRTPNEKHFCATVTLDGQEQIVGYTFLWETDKMIPWLGIAIHEKWKGYHLGRIMMSHLDTYAKEQGFGGLMLTTVPANIRAHTLYTNMGYEYMGSHTCGEYMYIKRYDMGK